MKKTENTSFEMQQVKPARTYMDSVHHYGRLWGLIMLVLIVAYPLVCCIIFRTMPDWNALFKGLLATLPMYWAVGLIEIFTYVPMLGIGGSYLSFITGNISNLKLPCALDAMERAGYKASSEEGEVVSTISIAVSSIVTTAIILVGVILLIPFGEQLPKILNSEIIAPAFDQILPALFGALGVVFVSKNPKLALVPVSLMLILFIAIPALNQGTVGIMVPVGVVVSILAAFIMYKKKWIK